MNHCSLATLLYLGLQLFHVVILQTIPRPTADASVSELLSFPAKGLLDANDIYQPIFTTCHQMPCSPAQFRIDTRVAGSVFKAQRMDTDQLVAVKFFAKTAYRTFPQKVQLEEVVLNKLDHPNLPKGICTFLGSDDRVGVVMEYIEGESLREWLSLNPPFPINLRNVARQLTGVLIYLHEQGIIHNDIKPENVIVQPNGHVFLIDFDLAAYDQHGAERRSGTTIYLAPEKFRIGRYFNAVDWYSFGVMLYEMFTGHNPFRHIAKLADIEAAAKRGLPRLKYRVLNDFVQNIAHPNCEVRWAQCNGHSDVIRNHPYLRDPSSGLE
jgi:serine/threonine protein kinase